MNAPFKPRRRAAPERPDRTPIGDAPTCIDCLHPLLVDSVLQAWARMQCGKSGTVERGVRVTVTRGAGV